MGLTTTTAKHLLLLLNFVFTVLGLILIGFGIFVLFSGGENHIDYGENAVAGVIIALGVLIVIVAIFGCLAAIHEARHKLLIYLMSIIVLILIKLIMISMTSHGTKDGLSGSVHDGFAKLWEFEQHETGALAYYEDWLHCCGVNNTEDYRVIDHEIPKSCCIQHNCQKPENIYPDGCQMKFEEYLWGKMLTFKIVCWILIITESIGAFLSWLMYSNLKNENRRSRVGWM